MCVNFIYDLNGNRGPNTVGKDIGFITALYPSDSIVVAPMPLNKDASSITADGSTTFVPQIDAGKVCTAIDNDSRVPNRYELSSIFYNKELVGDILNGTYWSSSVVSPDTAWRQNFATGNQEPDSPRTRRQKVRCIKR